MFVGMKIKTFPDTDVEAYVELVKSYGFHYRVMDGYILVCEQISRFEEKQDFAKRLRKARQDHELTLKELADKIGVNEATVYNWELAKYSPNGWNYQNLIEVLGDF